MTATELADKLHGRQYRKEMTREEGAEAKADGLVVVFGASDDLAELRGAIDDEVSAYGGRVFSVDAEGVSPPWPEDEEKGREEAEEYFRRHSLAKVTVRAGWDFEGYSWWIATTPPFDFAEFDIMDGNDKYCRGIVFRLPGTEAKGGGA